MAERLDKLENAAKKLAVDMAGLSRLEAEVFGSKH